MRDFWAKRKLDEITIKFKFQLRLFSYDLFITYSVVLIVLMSLIFYPSYISIYKFIFLNVLKEVIIVLLLVKYRGRIVKNVGWQYDTCTKYIQLENKTLDCIGRFLYFNLFCKNIIVIIIVIMFLRICRYSYILSNSNHFDHHLQSGTLSLLINR